MKDKLFFNNIGILLDLLLESILEEILLNIGEYFVTIFVDFPERRRV